MKLLCLQLPVPQQNIGNKTGNIPLGAHYLKAALAELDFLTVEIVPEAIATWYGDLCMINYIVEQKPDILAFSLFCWNIERSIYILGKVKEQLNLVAIGGGPEVHQDNTLLADSRFDYLVPGEGEQPLLDLIQKRFITTQSRPVWLPAQAADAILAKLDIRAMYAGVDTFCSQMLLVESQRGCPYQCGFCYYNKSRAGLYRFSDDDIVSVISTINNDDEYAVYLLDPSLNTRPDLPQFLDKLAASREHHLYRTYSETRAESITPQLAEAYRKAGFTELEIGLQTTNPKAMKLMNRQTKLKDFVAGCKALKKEYVVPKVDLIIGLPDDTLEAVKRSIDFIYRHNLIRSIQIFPLLLLHGTDFRAQSGEYGLQFQPEPPYQVLRTATMTWEDMFAAFTYAEDKLNIHFDPLPDLDLCETEILVNFADCIGKYHFYRNYTELELSWLAARLASTCQLHFYPQLYGVETIQAILSGLTALNPYGVYEIVLWEATVDTDLLLASIKVKRPHYLDNDRQYLYPEPGNRSVTFTAVLGETQKVFYGEMKRQIYFWDTDNLPTTGDFEAIRHLDGAFIEDEAIDQDIFSWFFEVYQELSYEFPICFNAPQIQHFIWEMTGREFNKNLLTQGEDR